jgi:hypothetical protein
MKTCEKCKYSIYFDYESMMSFKTTKELGCRRFPKMLIVSKSYSCGEFKRKWNSPFSKVIEAIKESYK